MSCTTSLLPATVFSLTVFVVSATYCVLGGIVLSHYIHIGHHASTKLEPLSCGGIWYLCLFGVLVAFFVAAYALAGVHYRKIYRSCTGRRNSGVASEIRPTHSNRTAQTLPLTEGANAATAPRTSPLRSISTPDLDDEDKDAEQQGGGLCCSPTAQYQEQQQQGQQRQRATNGYRAPVSSSVTVSVVVWDIKVLAMASLIILIWGGIIQSFRMDTVCTATYGPPLTSIWLLFEVTFWSGVLLVAYTLCCSNTSLLLGEEEEVVDVAGEENGVFLDRPIMIK